jgi:hypothetical protein
MIGDIWFIGLLIGLGIQIVYAGMKSERYTGYLGEQKLVNYIVDSVIISLVWPIAIPGFLLYELGKKLGKGDKNA